MSYRTIRRLDPLRHSKTVGFCQCSQSAAGKITGNEKRVRTYRTTLLVERTEELPR